jgi:hypothetical protein
MADHLQTACVSHQAHGVKTTKVKWPQSPSRTASLSHPKGAAMASRDHFQQELHAQIERAIERRAEQLIVNSGELLAAVAGVPSIKCGIAAT